MTPIDSPTLLAKALGALGAGVWAWDLRSSTVELDQTARQLCGLSADEPTVSVEWWLTPDNVHPEDASSRRIQLQTTARGEAENLCVDWRVRTPTGWRWVRCHGLIEQDAGGEPVRLIGTVTVSDTEHQLATELRRAQERYAVADSAGDGHTDWLVSEDEFYGSPRFLEVCGLPPDTVFGDRAGFIRHFPYHPDDQQEVVRSMSTFYASTAPRLETEMRMLIRGEERWVHLTGVATRDPNGVMVRWTGSITDITERKRSEQALRRSEERFQLAAAASTDGIWDWDIPADAMFLSERAQAILGLSPGTPTKTRAEWRAALRVHPDDVQGLRASADQYIAGQAELFDREFRVATDDGGWRWVRIRGLCLRTETGEATRFAGSVGDIDRQKRTDAARRQSQRLEAMGAMAGGIAHDFNNILGIILGYGEMAIQGTGEGSRQQRDIQQILIAGERGRALVDRVLAFSRSGIGERVLVHLESVVREAADLLQAGLPAGVAMHLNLHGGRGAVLGDATQVHQVIMNLATNALQAMPDGGELTIQVERRQPHAGFIVTTGTLAAGAYLVLQVRDTGIGITTETMERIFDPFFTTKEAAVGNGLGLSLVHGIVGELGGAVDVSTAVGVGSTFTVWLPAGGEVDVSPSTPAPALPKGRGEAVMVIDDEAPLLELVLRMLTDLGYDAHGYGSSRAALEAFRRAPRLFDAVVTDERMPGLSGTDLIREFRQVRPEVPILLVSGFPTVEDDPAAAPNATLRKPVSARALADGVALVLSSD